jgi:hypothetical protein
MNNILSWITHDIKNINLKSFEDPIPTFIEKLSSPEELKIRIQTNNDNTFIQSGKRVNSLTISHDWNKENLNLPKLQKALTLLSNKRSPNFPTNEQKNLLSKLRFIPTYTVVNKNNEIITASPRDYKTSYSLKWLREKSNELFFWSHDEGSVSINLFFMNKEDAASYLHEICKKEPKESENLGLKIKSVGLDVFYRLNRTSPPKTQSRLVADLSEVDQLLTSYIGKDKCRVHPKQKYSNNWFQGNPIYTMKLQKNPLRKTLSEYFFQNSSEKKIIFFNKEDAVKAWKIFLSKKMYFELNKNPYIEIYNLESLLLDIENNAEKTMDTIFVPPYDSYVEWTLAKKHLPPIESNILKDSIFKFQLNLKNLHRFYRGIIWLFTSDTLPSEENSW